MTTAISSAPCSNRAPVIALNRVSPFGRFSDVSMDNYGAGAQVAAYLASLSHRHVFIINGISSESYPLARLQGARDGFARVGATIVGETELDATAPDDAVQHISQQVIDSGATGVYVLGDSIAFRCVDPWRKMGVSIPGALSVVGFDAVDDALPCGGKLTSIAYDRHAMGKHMAEMAMQLIDQPGSIRRLSSTFRTSLVIGDTTGPVAD